MPKLCAAPHAPAHLLAHRAGRESPLQGQAIPFRAEPWPCSRNPHQHPRHKLQAPTLPPIITLMSCLFSYGRCLSFSLSLGPAGARFPPSRARGHSPLSGIPSTSFAAFASSARDSVGTPQASHMAVSPFSSLYIFCALNYYGRVWV